MEQLYFISYSWFDPSTNRATYGTTIVSITNLTTITQVETAVKTSISTTKPVNIVNMVNISPIRST